jgi:hypothetical protein
MPNGTITTMILGCDIDFLHLLSTYRDILGSILEKTGGSRGQYPSPMSLTSKA